MIEKIKERLKEHILEYKENIDMHILVIKKESLLSVIKTLHDEFNFNMLVDLTAIDWLDKKQERFEIVYHLRNLDENFMIRVKTSINENEEIDSITSIYRGANWLEREVYDMFGIIFKNHPNLERILMWESFQGHPLRKDFFIRTEVSLPENE
ncbi:MAG: NADH-quinone oxidoreductase subunit C [candidate division WOR-3 bacterium]|nr:NADH-quinone oxidoreductase subunit C [candidate division WOR-3 bacterium]MCX7948224.1 NADH-quinone oxidoreductase subunit C [candidate division WOR-3 bacterium]MDW8150026.1 NADH-quinone oxidoreductase subunit C [candidate division WOR-3 bacterium]